MGKCQTTNNEILHSKDLNPACQSVPSWEAVVLLNIPATSSSHVVPCVQSGLDSKLEIPGIHVVVPTLHSAFLRCRGPLENVEITVEITA